MRISALSFSLTPAIREHVENRMGMALSRTGVSPETAHVRLVDVNGDKGGVDKQCRVSVNVKNVGPVVAVVKSTDVYQAIDRAAAQIRNLLRRQLSRRRAKWSEDRSSLRMTPVA